MIFKKPYAFMIKHFKSIHLVLSFLLIILAVKINSIAQFFNSLVVNQSVSTIGASDKVNFLMYLVIILICLIGFFVCFLMKNKKKPRKYYIFLILYYVVLFVFLIIIKSALVTLEQTSVTNETLRIYRDLSFLIPIPQYYFLIIAVLRGIGFNVKQFNFSKDIKDLEIADEDSEEIELGVSNDIYKFERAGRKKLRELKYYFFENKFWILIIGSILIGGGLIYFLINYKFVNKNYGEGSMVNAGNYSFKVNNSFIVNKNIYGKTVQDGKNYIIVDLTIKNIYYENISFDTKKFRLFVGSDFYYPISNKNSSFQDLGLPYDNKYLERENSYNYILIYELDEDTSLFNVKLKVYDSIDYENSKVNYVNINLKPNKLDYDINNKNVDLNLDKVIDEDSFGKTYVNIKDYDILNKYEYNYNVCIEENCSKKTGVILPENVLKNILISIDYKLLIDKENNIYNFVKNDSSFFNTFVTISYNINDKNKTLKFTAIKNSNVKDKMFMEVSREIEDADSIELTINTRKVKYIYKLK